MATAFSDHSSMMSCLNNLCSLEPEDLILNDLLQDKCELSPPYICANCDECAKASSKCKECEEVLCESCVRAHIRVKLTKDHCIIPLDEGQLSNYSTSLNVSSNSHSPSNRSIVNGNTHCDIHITETVRLYCETCFTPICGECTMREHRGHSFIYLQDAVDSARSTSLKFLSEAKAGAQSMKENIEMIQQLNDSISLKTHSIARDVRAVFRKFQLAVEEREREMLAKLEKIRVAKQKILQQQIESLRNALSCFTHTSDMLSDILEVGSAMDILHAKESTFLELKKLRSIRVSIQAMDDDIHFTPPDSSLLLVISNMGDISCLSYPQHSNAIGESLFRSVCSRPSPPFCMLNKNSMIDDVPGPPETISPFINHDSSLNQSDLEEHKISLWSSNFRPKIEIPISHHLMMRNSRLPLPNSGIPPLNSSRSVRDYTEAGRAQVIFGGEGEKDGQLCRPWGVCCDSEGNIIVADRSNNRIQIFKSDGTFLRKFGSHGSEPGYFDRPAGVATDPIGRIVVTDKDNHRIQVFTSEGHFVFTFGEKGSKIGQFNYPWDIAVDSKGRIVVSDTRNHRIQLFAMDGTFLSKYGFENTANMWKHFDSPRGVCFGSKGCVIVTDFNNHRLVVIDPNFRNARFLGTEGSGVKQFLRPQGVAVDYEGNIIVADSRNNRIQVFEQNGSFLWQFGVSGKEPGQLDRPSGVCLTPDGKIVVVDFGNNRIQIF